MTLRPPHLAAKAAVATMTATSRVVGVRNDIRFSG